MSASARVLLLPRQLATPLRLAFTPSPFRAAARGYFSFSVLQQPHRCWARAAASSGTSSSSCEQYPQAPIAADPGASGSATCPRHGKGEGEAARGGEKAAGAQDDSSGACTPSPPAPKDKEALRVAAAAGRKGRSGGAPPPRQRGRTAKPHPQGKRPARPGDPKQGRGGGGGIIHAAPGSSSSASSLAVVDIVYSSEGDQETRKRGLISSSSGSIS